MEGQTGAEAGLKKRAGLSRVKGQTWAEAEGQTRVVILEYEQHEPPRQRLEQNPSLSSSRA